MTAIAAQTLLSVGARRSAAKVSAMSPAHPLRSRVRVGGRSSSTRACPCVGSGRTSGGAAGAGPGSGAGSGSGGTGRSGRKIPAGGEAGACSRISGVFVSTGAGGWTATGSGCVAQPASNAPAMSAAIPLCSTLFIRSRGTGVRRDHAGRTLSKLLECAAGRRPASSFVTPEEDADAREIGRRHPGPWRARTLPCPDRCAKSYLVSLRRARRRFARHA